jgi:hypothetical protein
MRLIGHYANLHHVGFLSGQVYLDPYQSELMWRNHWVKRFPQRARSGVEAPVVPDFVNVNTL